MSEKPTIMCLIENCFKNMDGVCVAGGVVNGVVCKDLDGQPLPNLQYCPECGSEYDPQFKGAKGQCPQCDPENHFYN